eukprot:jgi/Picre1/27100/NNA_000070.t1
MPVQFETHCIASIAYPVGDQIAVFLSLMCKIPYVMSLYRILVLHASRDINDVLLCLGYGLNTVVSKGLKEIIRQPRPDYGCESLGNCHEYGMPSNHAQFMAFCFAMTFLSYRAKKRVVACRGSKDGFAERLVTSNMFAIEILILGVASLIISWARVYLGYHSVIQVVAGYLLGIGFALIWWTLTSTLHSRGVLDAVCEALYAWCGVPIHNDTNSFWWPNAPSSFSSSKRKAS